MEKSRQIQGSRAGGTNPAPIGSWEPWGGSDPESQVGFVLEGLGAKQLCFTGQEGIEEYGPGRIGKGHFKKLRSWGSIAVNWKLTKIYQ